MAGGPGPGRDSRAGHRRPTGSAGAANRAAALAAALGLLAAGGGPAGPALAVGAATWLVLTARGRTSGRRERG